MWGARWVQQRILSGRPGALLRVYVVWLPVLPGDGRSRWRAWLIDDPRVAHYWDEQKLAGRWFARHLDGRDGMAWDRYYLFGPPAAWAERPAPAVASGGPIYARRASLANHVAALLGG